MCIYLNDLKNAFMKISNDYYENYALNNNGHGYIQRPENNFTCELVRLFRNNMEGNHNYNGLVCNMDLRKARLGITPDFVLHEANDNQNRQELFAEVKINPNSQLISDLEKIKQAISDDLNFNHAILIVANKPLARTLKIIKRFINLHNLTFEDNNKLHLFHSVIENGNRNFSIMNFNEING